MRHGGFCSRNTSMYVWCLKQSATDSKIITNKRERTAPHSGYQPQSLQCKSWTQAWAPHGCAGITGCVIFDKTWFQTDKAFCQKAAQKWPHRKLSNLTSPMCPLCTRCTDYSKKMDASIEWMFQCSTCANIWTFLFAFICTCFLSKFSA